MISVVQLQKTCTCVTKSTFVPFYQLFTPSVIQSTAEFTSTYSYSTTALTFGKDGDRRSRDRRLFKLPLIPATVLDRHADITVVITIGLQNTICNDVDSDPKVFLSDGNIGVGFDIRDGLHPNCDGMEASMGDTMGSSKDFDGPSPETRILSEEFTLTISPSHRWGSCFFAADSGTISPVSYTQTVYPDQGLWLEVYREGHAKEYVINYIIVEIHEN